MTRRLTTRATRRGVLGGLALGLTAAGCEVDATRDEPDSRTTGSEAAEPEPDDPDAQLVRRVVEDLTGALALVAGAPRARRPLASELAPWRDLHAAHLEALDAADRVRAVRVGGPASALRARVRRQETALQRRLAAAAVAAESGSLASLLGTMSAAVAQQLTADSTGNRP